jgi:deoxyribose-phosphate aldolase
MVSQFGMARGGDWGSFRRDIEGVFQVLHPRGILLKVILESSVLLPNQIAQATHICSDLGVAYVKTSTGFNGGGASEEAIEIMLNAVRGNTKVKASGGIRNLEQANRFIEMGCDRLGVGFSTTPVLFGDSAQANRSDY